ncbi:hypothetical protein [Austwickia chelonae]|uniref:Uncharacterized protein n=1 Tax=Austwickia chelonae NBRC 105200 TaxID=1184607 RepID=K6VSQ5_9MICO|nr:hypothetical protein AUCHE_08_06230 [Austwickia chelonae NBRC 105200]
MSAMAATLLVLARLCSATGSPRERERGDVPGWVLVTLMTAGLVTTIWAIAGDQLAQVFTTAISGVTGPGRK